MMAPKIQRRKQRLFGELAQGNRRHGLDPGMIDAMIEKQDGKCAICKNRLPTIPAVDHDHEMEAFHGHPGRGCPRCVRGLLCEHCNKMLGFARDKVSVLLAAAVYLAAWRKKDARD